jgi:hypothetical protein
MTLADSNRRTGPVATNGSTTVFTFDFYVKQDEDLLVEFMDSSGTVSTKTLNSEYTVTRTDSGGTITFTSAPAASGELLISGKEIRDQTWQLTGSVIDRDAIEEALDHLMRTVQQHEDKLNRAVLLHQFDSEAYDEGVVYPEILDADQGKFLKVSAKVSPAAPTFSFAALTSSGTITTTSFSESLLDDANAAQARTTLLAASSADLTTEQGLKKITIIDAQNSIVTRDGTQGDTSGFTAVDVSSYRTGAIQAQYAILRCVVSLNVNTSGHIIELTLRANGTTPTNPQMVRAQMPATVSGAFQVERTVFVPLDGSEVFEYSVDFTNANTSDCTVRIDMEGFVT